MGYSDLLRSFMVHAFTAWTISSRWGGLKFESYVHPIARSFGHAITVFPNLAPDVFALESKSTFFQALLDAVIGMELCRFLVFPFEFDFADSFCRVDRFIA